jgi:hypothetical protein
MSQYPSPTTGLGVAAKIAVAGNVVPLGQDAKASVNGYNNVVLSLSGTDFPTTFQLNPQLQDAAGNEVTLGTQFTLTSVANGSITVLTLSAVAASSNGTAVYTGTITGGGSNAFEGDTFTIAGFTNAVNNGVFTCNASTTTTLTLSNPDAVAETHAGTATPEQGTAVYTGTITGGGSNAFKGYTFTVAGFTNAVNNGTFICTASSTTTLTLENGAATSETHAATATTQELSNTLTFVAYGFKTLSGNTYQPSGSVEAVCTVSSSGLITGVAAGGSQVEVSYPTFNNSVGDIVSSGNPMNGLPIIKIYGEVSVTVLP